MENATPVKSEGDALPEARPVKVEAAKSGSDILAEMLGHTQRAVSKRIKDQRQREDLARKSARILHQIKFVEKKLDLLEKQKINERDFTEFLLWDLQNYNVEKMAKEKLIAELNDKLVELERQEKRVAAAKSGSYTSTEAPEATQDTEAPDGDAEEIIPITPAQCLQKEKCVETKQKNLPDCDKDVPIHELNEMFAELGKEVDDVAAPTSVSDTSTQTPRETKVVQNTEASDELKKQPQQFDISKKVTETIQRIKSMEYKLEQVTKPRIKRRGSVREQLQNIEAPHELEDQIIEEDIVMTSAEVIQKIESVQNELKQMEKPDHSLIEMMLVLHETRKEAYETLVDQLREKLAQCRRKEHLMMHLSK